MAGTGKECRHHVGVDRTLYLARKIDPSVTKVGVQKVVKCCERCQSIDPAPAVHKRGKLGSLEIGRDWKSMSHTTEKFYS